MTLSISCQKWLFPSFYCGFSTYSKNSADFCFFRPNHFLTAKGCKKRTESGNLAVKLARWQPSDCFLFYRGLWWRFLIGPCITLRPINKWMSLSYIYETMTKIVEGTFFWPIVINTWLEQKFDFFVSLKLVFVSSLLRVGCRRDVLDHTSCGIVFLIVLWITIFL